MKDIFDTVMSGDATGILIVGMLAGAVIWEILKHVFAAVQARVTKTHEVKLVRVDALRSDAYQEVWPLTGMFNTFGPPNQMDIDLLIRRLRDWYFRSGHLMTDKTRNAYFNVMEILCALSMKDMTPVRPADSALYLTREPTTKRMKLLMQQEVRKFTGHEEEEKPDNRGTNFQKCAISRSKTLYALMVCIGTEHKDMTELKETEFAWLVAQDAISTFRTRLTKDLSSRSLFRLLAS